MDSIVAAVVSGICSIASALGAVYLKEHLEGRRASATKPSPVVKPPVAVSFWRSIAVVAGSFLFGFFTRSLRTQSHTHYESLIALVILVLIVVALAVFHRRRGFPLVFQLENLALWSGWVSGWSFAHGRIWDDVLYATLVWWLGCAVVGGVVVSFRRKKVQQGPG